VSFSKATSLGSQLSIQVSLSSKVWNAVGQTRGVETVRLVTSVTNAKPISELIVCSFC
jgi:hypothetical protein